MPERRADKTQKPSLIIGIIGFLILLAAIGFWYNDIYLSSSNVFWGMINNNLTTNSVTRHVVQDESGRTVDQYIRLQFGALDASESRVTIKQEGTAGPSVVKSQTIGTPQNDYSRYTSISTPQKTSSGKPIDTTDVIGFWGKSEDPKSGQQSTAQYFSQSILTIVPYGNFSQQQRKDLIQLMQSQNVYDLSSGSIKSAKQDGRSVFIYDIKINPSAYVQLMQTYTKDLGLGDIGLDPSSYANSPPLSTEISVDKITRQITKISYPSSGQSETIVDQNLFQPIILPTQTIPIADLQKRIQNLSQ